MEIINILIIFPRMGVKRKASSSMALRMTLSSNSGSPSASPTTPSSPQNTQSTNASEPSGNKVQKYFELDLENRPENTRKQYAPKQKLFLVLNKSFH